MIGSRTLLVLASVIVALIAAVACGSDSDNAASGEGEAENLDVGIAIASYVHAVTWIADKKGYFHQQGIDAEIQTMGGSSATMQGLLSGNIDIGIAGGDSMVKANLAGGDLVVVAGLVNRFYHRLIARSDGPDLENLNGEIIGLPFLGGPQDTAVKYALQTAGLSYEDDVDVRSMGADFNRLVALSRGDIDVTTASLPPRRLSDLDLKIVADLPDWDVEFPYAVVVVRRSFLESNRPLVKSFLTAYCDGIGFYTDPDKRDENLEILADRFGTTADDAQHIDSYENRGVNFIASPPVPSAGAFATVLDFLGDPDARSIAPDEYFELEILEELEGSGRC